jgi:hypothetical protein
MEIRVPRSGRTSSTASLLRSPRPTLESSRQRLPPRPERPSRSRGSIVPGEDRSQQRVVGRPGMGR